jgi:hypothetical protein
VLNFLFSILTVLSIALVKPVFEIIFESDVVSPSPVANLELG